MWLGVPWALQTWNPVWRPLAALGLAISPWPRGGDAGCAQEVPGQRSQAEWPQATGTEGVPQGALIQVPFLGSLLARSSRMGVGSSSPSPSHRAGRASQAQVPGIHNTCGAVAPWLLETAEAQA